MRSSDDAARASRTCVWRGGEGGRGRGGGREVEDEEQLFFCLPKAIMYHQGLPLRVMGCYSMDTQCTRARGGERSGEEGRERERRGGEGGGGERAEGSPSYSLYEANVMW